MIKNKLFYKNVYNEERGFDALEGMLTETSDSNMVLETLTS